jgi:hypothetical protein
MKKLRLREEHLKKIRQLAKIGENNTYHFLGYSLDLETNQLHDLLQKNTTTDDWLLQNITVLLAHYSLANEVANKGKLIKFKDLPGGYAYEHAFTKRAVDPITKAFGNNTAELAEAAKLLGGKQLNYGHTSVEIPALEGIPIVYILWATPEFPASANLLFDQSASSFLDTETLSSLGELTTYRLLKAQIILKKENSEIIQ